MKTKLYVFLAICLFITTSTVVAETFSSKVTPINSDSRVFRFTADEVETAYVKWGPRFCWLLTSKEIDSFITILRKVRKEDIQPYHGPFPKGGPFQVTLLTNSDEQYTFTAGVGGVGYVLGLWERVYIPEFDNFMKPFIARRTNETN